MEQNVSGLVTIKGYAMDPDGNITSVQVRIGENLFNATDTSGNDSWYTWEIIWNTSGYEDGWFRVSALASDGTLKEDSHVEIKVNNSASSKGDQNENDDQKKKPPKSSIPGFEMPFLIAAAVAAVVVSFFRSGGRNRTKQI
jgi:hypothetical protein